MNVRCYFFSKGISIFSISLVYKKLYCVWFGFALTNFRISDKTTSLVAKSTLFFRSCTRIVCIIFIDHAILAPITSLFTLLTYCIIIICFYCKSLRTFAFAIYLHKILFANTFVIYFRVILTAFYTTFIFYHEALRTFAFAIYLHKILFANTFVIYFRVILTAFYTIFIFYHEALRTFAFAIYLHKICKTGFLVYSYTRVTYYCKVV
jgi:hypothetical protein